jgi:hypothetical protein
MNLLTASQSEKKSLDVTGIEPVTRCLQNSPTSSCKPFGHSPMTTTLEVYKHASGDSQRQAVNQIENQLFPIVLGLGQLAQFFWTQLPYVKTFPGSPFLDNFRFADNTPRTIAIRVQRAAHAMITRTDGAHLCYEAPALSNSISGRRP